MYDSNWKEQTFGKFFVYIQNEIVAPTWSTTYEAHGNTFMQCCIDNSNELGDGDELYVKIKNLEWMKALFIFGKK